MKLSIFYASALAAVASASNLRATIDSPSQFNDARISMVGLKQEADAEDLEIIGESLMAAINDMFTDPEMQAVTFEAKSGATVTSEVTPLKRVSYDAFTAVALPSVYSYTHSRILQLLVPPMRP